MEKYEFKYDLDLNSQPADGTLEFLKIGKVNCLLNGKKLYELDLNNVSDIKVEAGIGCGFIFVKLNDGDEKVLCRFSMSAMKTAGDFCQSVSFYIQTKQCVFPEQVAKQSCEKCGRTVVEGMTVCLFCYNKTGVIKKALILMKPFYKKILIAELFLTLAAAIYLVIPILNRFLIDEYLRPMKGPAVNILILAGAMFLARLLREIIFIISSRVFNKESFYYANHLKNLAFEKIQMLSLNSLSKRTSGDLIRRVMDDTNTIKDFLSNNGRVAIEHILMFVVVLIILLFTNFKLTLLILLPIPFVALLFYRFRRFINLRYTMQWHNFSKCQSILHDIIKGIRTVKSFGKEEDEIKKFSNASLKLAEVSSQNEVFWSLLFPALTFFTGIGEFLVMYFGGKGVLSGGISLGVYVQFTMYITYIYSPLRWLVSFPRWLAEALTSMVKVFEIIDEQPEITSNKNLQDVDLTGHMTFNNVWFGYKSYEPVLKNINFQIEPGEMIGLVGRSGSGKSTLINLVMRLYDPQQGEISINGVDIKDLSPDYFHENIGVVFQDCFLFAGTIYDNIAYAKPSATYKEVIAASKAANAHNFIMNLPDGYNTLIGEGGGTISGGEKQRLSIARAIIKNPKILILDEATSSLDVETEALIQESLNRLVKGRTTIAIAHRLSTLKNADRLIVIDKGKIAESGTHTQLLKQKSIYYKLVMAQRKTSKIAD